MHRVIRGLIWARACDRPRVIPVGRPRGAKRRGVAYEASLAAHLTFARHGQWFEFQDMNGVGYCQVDLLCEAEGRRLGEPRIVDVIEAKYSWVSEAHSQIDLLYRPVVEKALGGAQVFGIVVCKNVTGVPPGVAIASSYWEAHELARRSPGPVVWHWLGSQIKPSRRTGVRPRRSAKVPRSRELGL